MSKSSDIVPITTLLTDYTTDNLDEVIHDDIQLSGQKYKKLHIYNRHIKTPLQKIWLQTPQLKVFKPSFNNANQLSVQLSVILGPTKGDIKKFYMFIKKLERKVDSIVKSLLDKKMKMKSSIKSAEKFPPIMTLRMPCQKVNSCYEFAFNIYNNYNKRVTLDIITPGTYTTSFIELSEIWISDTEFGFNWSVLQMKLYPEFDFTKCLFDDCDDAPNEKEQECFHCLYCPNARLANARTHLCANNNNNMDIGMSIPIPPPPPMFMPMLMPSFDSGNKKDKQIKIIDDKKKFALSVQDILSVKLKPVKAKQNELTDKIDKINKIDEDMINIKNNLKSNEQ